MKTVLKKNKALFLVLFYLLLLGSMAVVIMRWDYQTGEIPEIFHVTLDKTLYLYSAVIIGIGIAVILALFLLPKMNLNIAIPAVILVFGSVIALMAPVFNGYDEVSHFYKTVATLDGKTFDYGSYSYEMSNSALRLMDNIFEKWYHFGTPWEKERTYVEALTLAYAQPTYPAYGYVFCVIGLGIGQLFRLPEGLCFVLGRLGNVIGFALMTWAALRIVPEKYSKSRMIIAFLALYAGTFTVVPYFSQDTVVYGLLAILFSLWLRMMASEEGKVLKDYILFGVLLILLGPLKLPYIFLGFLLFLIPKKNFAFRNKNGWILLLAAITLAAAAVWYVKVNSQFKDPRMPNVDGIEQLKFTLHHPVKVFVSVVYSLLSYIGIYPASLPSITNVYSSYFISTTAGWAMFLLLVPVSVYAAADMNLAKSVKYWTGTILVLIALCIVFALEVTYNTVGNTQKIAGVQGRYFLSLLLFLPAVLPASLTEKFRTEDEDRWNRIFTALCASSLIFYTLGYGLFIR